MCVNEGASKLSGGYVSSAPGVPNHKTHLGVAEVDFQFAGARCRIRRDDDTSGEPGCIVANDERSTVRKHKADASARRHAERLETGSGTLGGAIERRIGGRPTFRARCVVDLTNRDAVAEGRHVPFE